MSTVTSASHGLLLQRARSILGAPFSEYSAKVYVDEANLKREPGDGFEKVNAVYVRIPQGNGGHNLSRLYPIHSSTSVNSIYQGELGRLNEEAAVHREGVSFAMDTNLGWVELQDFGD